MGGLYRGFSEANIALLSLCLHGESIHLDLFNHGEQPVGASRGEVFRESYFADEIEVCVENFLCCMVVYHA